MTIAETEELDRLRSERPNLEAAIEHHQARWQKTEGHWPQYIGWHGPDGWHGIVDDYDVTRGFTHLEHVEASWPELVTWMSRYEGLVGR